MSLEQLIENVQKAQKACQDLPTTHLETDYVECQGLPDARRALTDFVLTHADELIAWERQHALRTSPFDEDRP